MAVDLGFFIKLFEGEHDFIFQLLERLDADIDEQHSPELIGEVLADLHEYADRHFKSEEILMEASGFPGIEDHRHEHQILIMRIDGLLEETSRTHEQSLRHDIIDMIAGGFKKHIEGLDGNFIGWFANKGWRAEDLKRFGMLLDGRS